MLNLDKLNPQLDLKDLDLEKIIRLALENQITLVKVILIGGSLLMGLTMFNDYRVKQRGLNNQMTLAQQKLDIIKARSAAMDDIGNYISSVSNNLPESKFITLISEYAKSYMVDINSLSPGDTRQLGLYDLDSVEVNASTDNFRNLLLFLEMIEKDKYFLRIDSWSGQGSNQAGEEGKINFDMKISAVHIHTS